jgi:hypothetical protein
VGEVADRWWPLEKLQLGAAGRLADVAVLVVAALAEQAIQLAALPGDADQVDV